MPSQTYLIFTLADTSLGFPLRPLKEVVRAVELMRVPSSKDGQVGLMDLRGEMLPVYDLRTLMGYERIGINPDQHFIIAGLGGTREAFLVDDIDEVVDLAPYGIERPTRTSLPPLVDCLVRYHSSLVFCLSDEKLANRSRDRGLLGERS